jgi:hypothetical protein
MRFLRSPSTQSPFSGIFDIVSGYTNKAIPPGSNMSLEELRKGKYVLTEKQWLTVRLQSWAFDLVPLNDPLPPFLANSIPRVHCGRPWHGRSHPSPPQEFPPYGVCATPDDPTCLSLSHITISSASRFGLDPHSLGGSRERAHAPDVRG